MIHQSLVVLGANTTLLEKTKTLISISEKKENKYYEFFRNLLDRCFTEQS
jgi:hypothetical protein